MPTEMRYIVFTPNEILRAITLYSQKRREPLPRGTIMGLKVEERPAIHVILSVKGDAKTVADEVKFQGAELAAALVMYCIERKIPLPATGAKKTLRMIDQQVGLEVSIGGGE